MMKDDGKIRTLRGKRIVYLNIHLNIALSSERRRDVRLMYFAFLVSKAFESALRVFN